MASKADLPFFLMPVEPSKFAAAPKSPQADLPFFVMPVDSKKIPSTPRCPQALAEQFAVVESALSKCQSVAAQCMCKDWATLHEQEEATQLRMENKQLRDALIAHAAGSCAGLGSIEACRIGDCGQNRQMKPSAPMVQTEVPHSPPHPARSQPPPPCSVPEQLPGVPYPTHSPQKSLVSTAARPSKDRDDEPLGKQDADCHSCPYSRAATLVEDDAHSSYPSVKSQQGCQHSSTGTVEPTKYSLLPAWKRRGTGIPLLRRAARTFHTEDFEEEGDEKEEEEVVPCQGEEIEFDNDFQPVRTDKGTPYTLHPFTMRRVILDLISLLFVSYDAVMIPMALFNLPQSTFLTTMAWTTRIFWTLDIPLSFFKGFVLPNGIVELSLHTVVRHYLRTWFVFDMALCLLDWCEVLYGSDGSPLGFMRAGRASRSIRIIRLVRLLRFMKLQEVLGLMTERISSLRVVLIAHLVKTILLTLGLAHLAACLWYGIGDMGINTGGKSWIRTYGYEKSSLAARYTMSLHWSISQLVGGMDEITPESVPERLFTIAMCAAGFSLGIMYVSNVTSAMTQLQIIGSSQAHQMILLRQYMQQNGISRRLMVRVQRNAQQSLEDNRRFMREDSVATLALVSEPLRIELHFEMYTPTLRTHRFFAEYIDSCPQVIRKVCHHATSTSLFSRGDVIFSMGEIPSPPKVYIVCVGTLRYSAFGENHVDIQEGQWISEATLWTTWMHRGVLTALTNCRLCTLHARSFQEISASFDHATFDPKVYAASFVEAMNTYSADVTDLFGEDLVYGVRKMHHPCAQKLGTRSQSLTKSWHASIWSSVRDIGAKVTPQS